MFKTICVFCSSSDAVDPMYFDAANELGATMAQRGIGLVYGGSNIGLMGTVARAVHQHGGQVIGVIPQTIHARGIAYDTADELIITRDLRERKGVMEARADAFVTLAGGFGTLEEVVEVITLKQLQTHVKPIILLNTGGFYDPLITLFEHFYAQHFAKPDQRQLYYIAPDVGSAFTYLDGYQPPQLESKWFG
jgi:cytokinin riboside 5'-monophosphate phosphoribohydrolase